ncbi:MAG: flagellar export chaperone FlgN [Candidatus Jordarchaeum sp.]|uniref:flagellar export chaperone FlgN n=1 Tax=Candidatus Jordarchaeum sp. TaxID=2823881 RepID=UPI004049E307
MKTKSQSQDITALYSLLNEELTQYQLLINGLKTESEYLRTGQVEPLIKMVRVIEEKIGNILEIESKVKNFIKMIIPYDSDKEASFSHLYSNISTYDRSKLKNIERELDLSKKEVQDINEKNKRFAQEYLSILSEIIRLIVSPPPEKLFYDRKGGCEKNIPLSLSSLNREV